MDNEKYGIELELITNKFNEKIEAIKRRVHDLDNQRIDMSKISKTDILQSKIKLSENEIQKWQIQFDKAQKDVEKRLAWDMEFISKVMRNATPEQRTSFVDNDKKLQQYLITLEEVANKTEEAKIRTAALKAKMNEGMNTKPIQKLNFNFDKIISKVKRFGLALISIRSIWSLVSRASSAYLAQDTEMANKLQAAWVGLGSVLAPIINFIATLMLKLVSVVNMVVKALTGVDLIAKATAKSMKGAAGSAKSLNKALAPFDELNNLDSDMGGGAGAGGINWADAFDSVDTDWAEMLQGFYNTIDTMSANGLKKIQDAKNKAVGIMQDMGWASGVINGYSLMMDGIGELWVGLTDVVKGVVEVIDGILTLDIDKIWKGLVDFFSGIGNAVMGVLDLVVGVIDMATSALWEGIKKAGIWIYNNLIQPIIKWFSNAWNSVKNKTFEIWDSIKTKVSNTWNSIKDFVVRVGEKAGEIISGAFKAVVNGVLSAIEKILNTPIRAINRLINVINEVPSINLRTLSTFSLPRLNVGTNYVPEDQIAMIHKGEAVIPKKFNSKEYFGGSNDETNARLDELIDAVRNIEINPYTTIKDVGKSALNYINNKSRQLGESVVV